MRSSYCRACTGPKDCHVRLFVFDKPEELVGGPDRPPQFKHPLIRGHASDIQILPPTFRRPNGNTQPIPSAAADWNNDRHRFTLEFRGELRDLKDLEMRLLEAAAEVADWADRFSARNTMLSLAELRDQDKMVLWFLRTSGRASADR
jgi:hypothetical protein